MRFGEAIEKALEGKKIARLWWAGKELYAYMTMGQLIPLDMWDARMPSQELTEVEKEKGYVNIMPHLDMISVQGVRTIGWNPSQADMLADDWYVVDEEDE